MNPHFSRRIIILASFSLCLHGIGFAQSPGAGLLGRRHAGADYTQLDFDSSRLHRARGCSLVVNLPWTEKVDFGLNYDQASLSGLERSASMKALMVSALVRERTPHGDAYLRIAAGHSWDRVSVLNVSSREDGGLWSVGAGYEIPVAAGTAIDASLAFSDAFSGRTARNQQLEFRLEASHVLSSRVVGVLAVAYHQIRREPDGMLYAGGLRWLF